MNVALVRVLFAHALVAAPRLALGRLAVLGRLLGDPRLGMAGAFLSIRRVLPRSARGRHGEGAASIRGWSAPCEVGGHGTGG
jgi:hypothetical protein